MKNNLATEVVKEVVAIFITAATYFLIYLVAAIAGSRNPDIAALAGMLFVGYSRNLRKDVAWLK